MTRTAKSSPTPQSVPAEEVRQKRKAQDEAAFKERLFNTLINHLEKGFARETLEAELRLLSNKKGKSAVKLFQEAEITTPKDRQQLARIIYLLYPAEPNKTFKTEPSNLYDWLKKLSADTEHHRHLQDFNHLLQSIEPRKSRAVLLFIVTLMTAGLGIYFYFRPDHFRVIEQFIESIMPTFWRFLDNTFSILKNIPLLLVLNNALSIPLQAYRTYHDNFRSPVRRFQKWLVGTLPPALALTGYILCYLAQGVFTPLAATLFILSSLVDVVNSIVNLFVCLEKIPSEKVPSSLFQRIGDTLEKLFYLPKYLEKLAQSQDFDSLAKKLDFVRQKERLYRTLKTVGVNMLAASVIAITVILWCIFPPSFALMVSCIALINCVNFTRSAALSSIHTSGAQALQEELDKTYRYHETPEQGNSDKPTISNRIEERAVVSELPRLKRSYSCSSLPSPTTSGLSFFNATSSTPTPPDDSNSQDLQAQTIQSL